MPCIEGRGGRGLGEVSGGGDFDFDAGKGTAFAEVDGFEVVGNELGLFRVAEVERDRQFEGFGFGLFLYGGDEAVFAYPECFSIHLALDWSLQDCLAWGGLLIPGAAKALSIGFSAFGILVIYKESDFASCFNAQNVSDRVCFYRIFLPTNNL